MNIAKCLHPILLKSGVRVEYARGRRSPLWGPGLLVQVATESHAEGGAAGYLEVCVSWHQNKKNGLRLFGDRSLFLCLPSYPFIPAPINALRETRETIAVNMHARGGVF